MQLEYEPILSASQLKAWDGCLARAGARYLAGLKEPEGPAAALGKAVHAEMEAWVLDGTVPTHKVACALMKHVVPPRTAVVEREILFATASSNWRGFIDLQFSIRDGHPSPELFDGDIVIQDWKTTSNLAYAKTVEDLLVDVQANLYAYEAFTGLNATSVEGRWIYVATKGSPTTRPTIIPFEKSRVVDFVEGECDRKAAEVQKIYKIRPKWTELPKDTSHCYDFKIECPYRKECNPQSRIKMPTGDSMSAEFRTAMQNFPGVQSAPAVPPKAPGVPPKVYAPAVPAAVPPKVPAPVVPPKTTVGQDMQAAVAAARAAAKPAEDDLTDEAARALVAEHLKAQGKDPSYATSPAPVVESGFVNPARYAPSVPAASPEQAVALQGITKKEAVIVEDDLTPLTKDQLVGVGLQMGLKVSKRMGEDTVRNHIRAARINGVPAVVSVPDQAEAIMAQAGMDAPVPDVQVAVSPEAVDAAISQLFDAPPAGTKVAVLGLHEIVDAANTRLSEKHPSIRDWREIQYTSAAELNTAAYDLFVEGELRADVVVFDDRTPEGAVLKSTLTSLARSSMFVLVRGDLV